MRRIRLFPADELGPNKARQVVLDDGPPIAVYNLNGEFFATDDTCTHGEASLAEGEIDGDEIVCPFHMGAFDIRSGEATKAPCTKALRTHDVCIVGASLYVTLGDE